MTPAEQRERLEALAGVLRQQGALLGDLVRLSKEEQDALVQSDFDAIHRASERMLAVSQDLELLDREREALVTGFGNKIAGLRKVKWQCFIKTWKIFHRHRWILPGFFIIHSRLLCIRTAYMQEY